MVDKNMVLGNLQIIKVWAQNGRKEEPGINPIRCEKVEKWIDETIELLGAQGPAEPWNGSGDDYDEHRFSGLLSED